MSITITYPVTGHSRTHRNLSQSKINELINLLSDQNEDYPVPVKIIVADDVQ